MNKNLDEIVEYRGVTDLVVAEVLSDNNKEGEGYKTGEVYELAGVGEISNIFYGAAKTKLKESGFDLNMTIPQPCWTKDLPAVANKSLVMIIPFKIENKDCFVEIVLF